MCKENGYSPGAMSQYVGQAGFGPSILILTMTCCVRWTAPGCIDSRVTLPRGGELGKVVACLRGIARRSLRHLQVPNDSCYSLNL